MMNNKNVILVTGATGNVGRHVVSQLLREGVRVRALTRTPASSGLPREVDIVRGDLASPETLDAAVKGTDAAFLLWRLPTTGTAPEVVERISKHTRRIVFLSTSTIRDDIEEQTDVIARIHGDLEHAIKNSAPEWTFLRPGGFATNCALVVGSSDPSGRCGALALRYGSAGSDP